MVLPHHVRTLTRRHRYNTRSRTRAADKQQSAGRTAAEDDPPGCAATDADASLDPEEPPSGVLLATPERQIRRAPPSTLSPRGGRLWAPPGDSHSDGEGSSGSSESSGADHHAQVDRRRHRRRHRCRRCRGRQRRIHPGQSTPPPAASVRIRYVPPLPYPLGHLIDDIAVAIQRHAPALVHAPPAAAGRHHHHDHHHHHHHHDHHRSMPLPHACHRAVHAPLRRLRIQSHGEWSSRYLESELHDVSDHGDGDEADASIASGDDRDAAWDIDEHNAYRVEYSPRTPPLTPEPLPDAPDDMPDADVDLDGVDVERQRAILAEIGRHATCINGIEVPPPPETGESEADSGPLQCVACAVHRRATLIDDCGHVVLCVTCARRICHGSQRVCPVCRVPITRIVRAYIPG